MVSSSLWLFLVGDFAVVNIVNHLSQDQVSDGQAATEGAEPYAFDKGHAKRIESSGLRWRLLQTVADRSQSDVT